MQFCIIWVLSLKKRALTLLIYPADARKIKDLFFSKFFFNIFQRSKISFAVASTENLFFSSALSAAARNSSSFFPCGTICAFAATTSRIMIIYSFSVCLNWHLRLLLKENAPASKYFSRGTFAQLSVLSFLQIFLHYITCDASKDSVMCILFTLLRVTIKKYVPSPPHTSDVAHIAEYFANSL